MVVLEERVCEKKMVALEERQIFDHSLSDEERRVVERMLSKKFQILIVGVDQEAEQKVGFPSPYDLTIF